MNSPLECPIYEATSRKVGRPITRPEEERTRVKAKKLKRDMTEEEIAKMKERMAELRQIKAEKAQARKAAV